MTSEKEENTPTPEIKTKEKKADVPFHERQDWIAWIIGVLGLILLIGSIFGFGMLRGWDANSGYTHNASATSDDRFLPEPFVEEPGVPGRFGNGRTGRWYYWKLKPEDVSWRSRLFVWFSYILHQFTVWIAIYQLQKNKHNKPKEETYSYKLNFWNWFAFGANLFFHLLHLLQTHITYDGTAQDVSVASSQGSVIMLLIFVLIIEYRDRGIVFGWPSQYDRGKWSLRLRLPYEPMYLVRRYHGYAFAWAAVYTFWFHPMENTWGHATGFMLTYAILLQGSLAFTAVHLNKYWRFLLETWVTAHGGIVAAQTGGPDLLGTKLWPMFFFGFAFVIFVTQLYGLPFWRKIPKWTRVFPIIVIYVPITLYCYSWIPDDNGRTWVRLQEIIRIPAVYYLFFFVIWGWTYLLIKIQDWQCPLSTEIKPIARAGCLIGIVLFYGLFVGISAAIQIGDLQLDLIALMIIFVAIFMIGVSITNILFNFVMGKGVSPDGESQSSPIIQETNIADGTNM